MSDPLHVFRFRVEFTESSLSGQGSADVPLCSGAFSECTGLEASMEPTVIEEGGRNYGAAQRAGRTSFATVVLKRGITTTQHLWKWFELVARGGYAYRLTAKVTLLDYKEGNEAKALFSWSLERALPVKFKAADFNATGSEVGVEELHLAHEGLSLVTEARQSS
jgi:phage tail-like protein